MLERLAGRRFRDMFCWIFLPCLPRKPGGPTERLRSRRYATDYGANGPSYSDFSAAGLNSSQGVRSR